MPKPRRPSFDECLKMMRKRDAMIAEGGFFELLPRAHEHVHELIAAFEREQSRPMRCWLLELIAEARSDAAFETLSQQLHSEDESLRSWAIRGLRKLDTFHSRKLLFENGLKDPQPGE